MPRKKSYPRPWVSTGCGSYRLLREGVFELLWRPDGRAGPKRRRRVEWSESEVLAYLAAQAEHRKRRQMGLIPRLDWDSAIAQYAVTLSAKGVKPKYRDESLALLDSLRFHAGVALVNIRPEHCEAWLNWLALRAQKQGASGWARTCNRKRGMVAPFFARLARKGFLDLDPIKACDLFRETKRAPRNLTAEEYARVWKISEPLLRDLLDWFLITGARFAEVAKAKRSDVQDGVWLVAQRKGRNDHAVVLPPLCHEIFLRQPKTDSGLLFSKQVLPGTGWHKSKHFKPGSPLENSYFCKLLRARCKTADVRYFTAHALRHLGATLADEKGLSLRWIQQFLGHTRYETTLRYTHGRLQAGANVVQKAVADARDAAIQTLAQ